MAHFAKIGTNGKVIAVLTINTNTVGHHLEEITQGSVILGMKKIKFFGQKKIILHG